MDTPPHGLLGEKVGPLPLVVWVGLGAGVVAIALALRGKRSSSASSSIDMLAPSAAEAFGTLEQQQADLTNALSQLGMGQSSLSDQLGQTQAGLGVLGSGLFRAIQGNQQAVIANLHAATGTGDPGAELAQSGDYWSAAQTSLGTLSTPQAQGRPVPDHLQMVQ